MKAADLLVFGIVGVGVLALYKSGDLQKFINDLQQRISNKGSNSNSGSTPITTSGVDKFGVQKMFASTGKEIYDFYPSHNPGRREWAMDANGLLNMEVTAYAQITGNDSFAIKVRGGKHTDSNPDYGTCYTFDFPTGSNDKATFSKEKPHPVYCKLEIPTLVSKGGLSGKMIGYKAAIWNTPNNTVKFKSWIDPDGIINGKPANNWKLYIDGEDKGQLCTGDKKDPFLKSPMFGSNHIIHFRVDNSTLPELKFVSAREISGSTSANYTNIITRLANIQSLY